MRSGLEWDETYDLGTPITQMLYLRSDMAGFAAAQPLGHGIGEFQQYSSGSTNILCSVLLERAGGDAGLVDDLLFAPLGLSSAVWETDGTGTPVCSSYLWATPRDWAALGQFALADGVWEGERLLPEDWMTQSTTNVGAAESDADAYGMSWWLNQRADGTLRYPTLPSDAYWMSGHDGQRVYVVPSADLVVVRMGFSPGVRPDLRSTNSSPTSSPRWPLIRSASMSGSRSPRGCRPCRHRPRGSPDPRHRPDPFDHLVAVHRLGAQPQRAPYMSGGCPFIPHARIVVLEGHVLGQARVVRLDRTPVMHVLGGAEGLDHDVVRVIGGLHLVEEDLETDADHFAMPVQPCMRVHRDLVLGVDLLGPRSKALRLGDQAADSGGSRGVVGPQRGHSGDWFSSGSVLTQWNGEMSSSV